MREPPTLEQHERDLDDLTGRMEGQQHLIEALYQVLAANLAPGEKAKLRRHLVEIAETYEGGPLPLTAEAQPIRRVLSCIAQPRPKLKLILGGLFAPPPAKQ